MREAVIESLLVAHYSPRAQIAGTFHVSTHNIYAWVERTDPISNDACDGEESAEKIRLFLRNNPSPYQVAKRPIAERQLLVVAERSRIGDWEGDTARGGNRKSALVVHTERKSGFVAASALPRASAHAVHATAVRHSKALPVSTITYDNGSEFALHRMIENDPTPKCSLHDPVIPRPWHMREHDWTLREFFPKAHGSISYETAMLRGLAQSQPPAAQTPTLWQTPCQCSVTVAPKL